MSILPLPVKHCVFVVKTQCFSLFSELLSGKCSVFICHHEEKRLVFPYVFPYGVLFRFHTFIKGLRPGRTFSGHRLGNMAVNIHRECRGGVSQICLDIFDIITGLQQSPCHIQALNNYIYYYNNDRISLKFKKNESGAIPNSFTSKLILYFV